MALKRQQNLMAEFSMASMTDVIFLLLIFFMVTSTFVFPTAMEVNLPQSATQTKANKSAIRIYIDSDSQLFTVKGDGEPEPMPFENLETWLRLALEDQPDAFVALYADESVPYGEVVKILDRGAKMDIKIMLATTPYPSRPEPTATITTEQAAETSTTEIQSTPLTDGQ